MPWSGQSLAAVPVGLGLPMVLRAPLGRDTPHCDTRSLDKDVCPASPCEWTSPWAQDRQAGRRGCPAEGCRVVWSPRDWAASGRVLLGT